MGKTSKIASYRKRRPKEEILARSLRVRKGATRYCLYGTCKSDSRNADELEMAGVTWLPFPKPHLQREKCRKWILACGRPDFEESKVRKWTYICSRHFVGGMGPTEMYPDPVPAAYDARQQQRFSRKRKAPAPRHSTTTLQQSRDCADYENYATLEAATSLMLLQSSLLNTSVCDDVTVTEHSEHADRASPEEELSESQTAMALRLKSRQTQTTYTCSVGLAKKLLLRAKDTHHKNESFRYVHLKRDPNKFRFYTGLTIDSFEHLISWLRTSKDKLHYWKAGGVFPFKSKTLGRKRVLSESDQLVMTLVRLRHGLSIQDIAYRYAIGKATVSGIVITWIQLMYQQFLTIRRHMFPSFDLIEQHRPPSFAPFKKVRVIIDAFEIFTQTPRNFAELGNMYSTYKHNSTYKVLVGICPTGAITYISDCFEGAISDRELVKASDFLEFIIPSETVMADRGFLIRDLLQERGADLIIPPFLSKRQKLSPQEEILTKQIARVRIHVERAIERMKKFRIIGRLCPLSLRPLMSQIVFVVACLVNYQAPLVS